MIPIAAIFSGLKFNVDFFTGYSPERINPGDKVNTLTTIVKVTSGSTPEIAEEIDQLYKDKNKWNQKSLMNIASSGPFSADFTIQRYAEEIWKIDSQLTDLHQKTVLTEPI